MNCKTGSSRVGASILAAAIGMVSLPAWAAHATFDTSNFEIDNDANFTQDDPAPSIDWLTPSVLSAVKTADDLPTGSTDDSFKGGTKEDSLNPQTTFGSIPNNKSDLLHFGVYQERTDKDYLHLFWTRVQDPSGTTLMDFEFNQATDTYNQTNTGAVFAVREAGDLLVEYKLAQGGVTPELFLYEWLESETDGVCEASNSYPCWGNRTDLTGAGDAVGSVNSSPADSGALGYGTLDPFTFGEASLNLTNIFPEGECRSFGLAHLKSRSSDSFTAQMKDFIAPIPVNISNCATIKITKTDDNNDSPTALEGAVFRLYNDDGDTPTVFDDPAAEPAPTNPDTRAQQLVEVADGVFELVDIPDCPTDGNGECTFQNIQAGDYCVVEIEAPTGHSLADPYWDCDTLAADPPEGQGPGLTFMFVNPRIPGTVNIQKEDEDGTLLNGWIFTLWTDVGGEPDASTGLSCETGAGEAADGVCTIEGILPPAGEASATYCVVETNPLPAQYQDAVGPKCGLVVWLGDKNDAGEVALNNLTFVNPRIPGAIDIQKEDEDGSLLNGWTFTLWTDVGGEPGASTGLSCETGAGEAADGVCTIEGILPPAGETSATWCVVETNPLPAQYQDAIGPKCGIQVVLGDTTSNDLTFVNPRIPGAIDIQKEDEDGSLLNGWTFTLWTDVAGEPGVSTGLNCVTAAGVCTIEGILPPAGETSATYCVVETNPLPAQYQDAVGPKCGIVVALGDTTSNDLTFVNPRIPGAIDILKEDDEGTLLNGWTFTLWTEVAGEPGVSTGLSCVTADGVCTIEGILPPAGSTSATWCVVETNPLPAQYEDAEGPQCGIVVALGDTTSNNLTFVNPRLTGAILITKTRKHKAAEVNPDPHVGVHFTVSGGGLEAPIEVVTDDNGKACVDGLLLSSFDGDYTVNEIVPANYVSDDEEQDVTVSVASTCGDGNEAPLFFVNTPLTDVTIIVDSLVDGGTETNVKCTLTSIEGSPTDTDNTAEDLTVNLRDRLPGTYTCIIEIDP